MTSHDRWQIYVLRRRHDELMWQHAHLKAALTIFLLASVIIAALVIGAALALFG